MSNANTALATSTLPQYRASAAIMERFLVAAHDEGASIERSPNDAKIKLVDGSELSTDALTYFIKNKENFRAEFKADLKGKLSDKEVQAFCEVIANEWFDGKRLRQEGRPKQLKRSVYDYLCLITNSEPGSGALVQSLALPTDVEPLISAAGIAAILTVNDHMIHRHVEEWKQEHPNYHTLSNSDVFLRRGLALEKELDTDMPYREWDFINSYSIAFSAPEKFSQMMNGRKPAIVNGDLALFGGRMLFFSPFIPGMDIGQLEFGIIPSEKALPIHFQGSHGGILEYIIDPAPFQA